MRKSITVEQREKKNEKFYQDMNKLSLKSRNGFFSDPISLAVGDIGYTAPVRKRDMDGNVPTGKKTFTITKTKHGKSDNYLFSKPNYNGIGDPYDEPWKSLQLRSSVNSSSSRQRPFTAGGKVKQKDPASFLKNQLIERESRREGPGKVKTSNPNFVTSNSKVGGGKTTPGV
jgi:hypothetical protein